MLLQQDQAGYVISDGYEKLRIIKYPWHHVYDIRYQILTLFSMRKIETGLGKRSIAVSTV